MAEKKESFIATTIRLPRGHPDYLFLFSTFLLLCVGLIMVLSTSPTVGFEHYNDSFYFVKRHLIYMFLGLTALVGGILVDTAFYKKWSGAALMGTWLLLVITLIPGIGVSAGGSTRWLNLGIFSFQPSEIAKIVVIIFLAMSLENKSTNIRDFTKGLLPILMLVGFISLFILIQPDLGTTIVIVFVTFIMLYTSGAKTWHLFILSLIGARAVLWMIWHSEYQKARVLAFINPWEDPLGRGFHVIQAWLAVGSGGLLGLGLGNSRQKYFYLPQQFTDFIFAILCEEGGFIIASLVVILYGVFCFRGLRIARQSQNLFNRYLAFGIIIWLTIQAFINICVVVGLLPTTGIPLTFISFGGTALVLNLFSVGIVTRVAMENYALLNTETGAK